MKSMHVFDSRKSEELAASYDSWQPRPGTVWQVYAIQRDGHAYDLRKFGPGTERECLDYIATQRAIDPHYRCIGVFDVDNPERGDAALDLEEIACQREAL